MTREELLNTKADFYWFYDKIVFVSTPTDNYLWSALNVYGNDTMTKYEGSISDYMKLKALHVGSYTGNHLVKDYCGTTFTLVEV